MTSRVTQRRPALFICLGRKGSAYHNVSQSRFGTGDVTGDDIMAVLFEYNTRGALCALHQT